MTDSKSVIPLESNPAIFSELAHKLGLSPVAEFHDVYSLTDPDLLAFLPAPVYGVILLFPLTSNYESYRKTEDSKLLEEYKNQDIDTIKWYKQTIGNGCGLYALLHILSNLPRDLVINNSILSSLLNKLDERISVEETAKIVEDLEASIKLDENYGEKGQTAAPSADESVYFHFITYIKGKDNHLYELDGRRKGPIDLGESVKESNIINDPHVREKIQFYIDNADEANKHNFAIMAIAPSMG
ncbi:ubiquitinyl hydrolase 1 [Scheffersomyces xylosifermentans]|uniref:ubiquitinyl hydrolase 1 n=1 Tax=Scheffersomyces xylosifermentans TaxID=1304137 RepID=UPI00315C50F9